MECERLRATGSQHYKDGHFIAAIEAYEKACSSAPPDKAAQYLSNLSASYYELGDYERALEYIDRAFEHVHEQAGNDSGIAALDLKLRLRECRCLLQMQEFDQLLDAIQEVAQSVYDEHVDFGVIEDAALHSLDQLSVWSSAQANNFVTSLPRKRPQAKAKRKCRQAMAYDKVPATSFLRLPGTRETASVDCQIRMNEFKWSHLSFFCGNIDIRHVIATMIDIYDQNPKTAFSIKMMLLDEDPCVVARSTIILFLIEELSQLKIDDPTEPRTVELLTLLHYTYVGAMMPLWVHERLLSTIRVISTRLCSGQGIPAWLDFSLETIDQIMPVFKFWTGSAVNQVSIEQCMAMQKSAAGPMDEYPPTPASKQRAAELRNQARSDIQVAIANFSEDQLDHILQKSCATLSTMAIKAKRETALKLFATDDALDTLNRKRYVPDGLLMEHSTFYQGGLKMLYMPVQVHHREPKLIDHVTQLWIAWADYAEGTKRSDDPLATQTLQAAIEYIKRHWKANVTLVPLSSDNPDLAFDPFSIVQLATQAEPQLSEPLWLFDYTSHWFLRAAKAVQKHGPVFYFEWRIGDAHSALDQVQRSEEGRFDVFDRIFLGEEAEEHGGLLAQTFDSLLNLNIGQHTFMACRMPEVKTSDAERILLDGTALPDLRAVQLYLGLVPHGNLPFVDRNVAGYHCWRPASTPLTMGRIGDPDGLKRESLADWLYQVFLNLALPRKRPSRSKMAFPSEPLNLHAFFRLLIYLQSIGIPGHWLGQVVDNLIQHRVVTRARPLLALQEPMGGSSGATQSATASGCVSATTAAKAICVMPFALEMEAALCIWFPLLTFGVTCVDFPDAHGIRLYTVKLPAPLPQASANGVDGEDSATLALWFSQTNKRPLGIDLSRDLVGSHAAAPGIRIVSSFNWDPVERQASFLCWSLSMDWLVAQNWHVRLVRTGLWDTASTVVSVKACKSGISVSDYQEPL